jgi:NADH-quinone oxidoreductase subunit I
VKEVPELPTGDRRGMWLAMDELLTWNPQSDVAKPYPPKGASAGNPGRAR